MKSDKSNEIHRIFLARAKHEHSGCIDCGRKIIESFYQKNNKKNKEYMCSCRLHVSPLAGTPMNKSHIPLSTWFGLIHDILTSKVGINAKYVQDTYQLSNNSAWSLLHRIKDWLNLVEKNEYCSERSKFVRVQDRYIADYYLKYLGKVPLKTMEKKMLEILPPLFSHVRESRNVN